MNKVFASPQEAIADLTDGASIAIGGFGVAHRFPSSLLAALKESHAKDLCIVGNTVGVGGDVRQELVATGRVKKLIVCFAPRPGDPDVDDLLRSGKLEVELIPQGTMVERCRAAGAGIPGFYTPTAAGTLIAEGKDVRYFDGRPYVLERSLPLDYAFVHAWRADPLGNVQFRGASQNFGPSFAKAARVAILEVDEIVGIGDIPPSDVDLPGIFVARVVKRTVEVTVEDGVGRSLRRRAADSSKWYLGKPALTRTEIALNTAILLPESSYVNLGIGIPTMVSNYLAGRDVTLHAENGVLGYGHLVSGADIEPDVYNAGGQYVALNPGAAFFESVTSFEMARSGKLSAVVLGAYQVDSQGNVANWKTPESGGGIGGAMDLVAGGCRLFITMEHRDSHDRPKLVRVCDYPTTGMGCVNDVITDLAVLHRNPGGRFVLEKVAPGFTPQEVQQLTDMEFELAPKVGTMATLEDFRRSKGQ